jgi:hypothetical protein
MILGDLFSLFVAQILIFDALKLNGLCGVQY